MALLIGGNTLQVRRVMQREPAAGGGFSYFETFQFRTKDTLASLLGVSLGSWSDWQSIGRTELVYVDENGQEITP